MPSKAPAIAGPSKIAAKFVDCIMALAFSSLPFSTISGIKASRAGLNTVENVARTNDTQKIIRFINSIYLPNKVVILKEPDIKNSLIEELVPFIKDYNQIKNQATVYVCKNQKCQLPITDIKKMKQLLY